MRWAPLSGVAFAIVAFANVVLTNIPDLGDSNAMAADFYRSASHRHKEVVAAYTGIVAALLFVVFVYAIYLRLRARRQELGVLTLAASIGFAAVSITAQATFLAPTAAVSLGFSSAKVVDPSFAREASTLADAILFAGFALAGLAVLALSAGLLADGAARWLGWFGVAAGVLTLLATLTFFPMLILPVWAAVTGVALSVRRPAGALATP